MSKTYQVIFTQVNSDNSHNINIQRPTFTVFAKSYQEAIGHAITSIDHYGHSLKLYQVIEDNYPESNNLVWQSEESKQNYQRAELFRQSLLN